MWLQAPNGGFGGSERHDPHLLYTVSAVQVMALYDRLDELDAQRIASCALPALHAARPDSVSLRLTV